jgi:hypothetical protein
LKPFQIFPADQDFVHDKHQTEVMFLIFNLEFGKQKLIERQQQAMLAGQLNPQSVRLGITRPAFG